MCCRLKYKKRTKRFFVDTHESPANRKCRKKQTAHYLKRECLMHRSYQISLKEELKFEKKELVLPGKGYRYQNEDGLNKLNFFNALNLTISQRTIASPCYLGML